MKTPLVGVGFSVNAEVVTFFKAKNGEEKLLGEKFKIDFSGSSANFATGINNFNIDTVLFGAVGINGSDSDDLLNLALNKTGLTFKRIPVLTESNVATVSINHEGKTQIVGFRGSIIPDRIPRVEQEINRTGSLWRIATGITAEQFKLAKCFLNSQPGFRSLSPHRTFCNVSHRSSIFELMKLSDLFILNEKEFNELEISFEEIHNQGVSLIVVTAGENGGEYSFNGARMNYQPKEQIKTKSAAGAGDWFHAGLIIACIKRGLALNELGPHLSEVFDFAISVASKKITMGGGGSNGPMEEDIIL